MFEILVFENQEVYALYRGSTPQMVPKLCAQYLTPGHVAVEFGETYCLVRDTSGCHKPCMIMAIGPLTDDQKRTLSALATTN